MSGHQRHGPLRCSRRGYRISLFPIICAAAAVLGVASAAEVKAASRGQSSTPICSAPSSADVWKSDAVRARLNATHPQVLDVEVLASAAVGELAPEQRAGHWVHVGESGPVNGVIIWAPCGSGSAVVVEQTGGLIDYAFLPRTSQLPSRVQLTTVRSGTGAEWQTTLIVAHAGAHPKVLWSELTLERIDASFSLHEETEIIWSTDQTRATLSTPRCESSRKPVTEIRHLCWHSAKVRYRSCSRREFSAMGARQRVVAKRPL